MRTVALLRFLADSGLRARVTAATNKAEAYNGFSAWTPVRQPGRDRRERPGRAGKSVKWNSLLCNLIVFHTAIDMMEVIRQLVAEGWQVTAEDLAQLSPYLTSHILRFGAYATDELHIPPPGLVRHTSSVIAVTSGAVAIGDLSVAAGVSSTHLAQRFKELIGVTPKRLARTYRFAATVFAINPAGPIDWGDLAGGAGYFDQAHFGHEFRAFTGLTPTRYVEVRRRFLREHPGHALDGWPLPAD